MNMFARARLASAGTACFTAALLVGASAPAQAMSQARTVENRAAAVDQDRRICVRAELTGTRMIRRICKTAAEWERAGGLPSKD